jgi:hypothetical protein
MALKYTLKDGTPVCYLRPLHSQLGHCHFAYPIYRDGKGLVSFEEVQRRGLDSYTPVHPDEYNLTEVCACGRMFITG